MHNSHHVLTAAPLNANENDLHLRLDLIIVAPAVTHELFANVCSVIESESGLI